MSRNVALEVHCALTKYHEIEPATEAMAPIAGLPIRASVGGVGAENIETVRRACEAWGTGDISIYREMYAPDVTVFAGALAPETKIASRRSGSGHPSISVRCAVAVSHRLIPATVASRVPFSVVSSTRKAAVVALVMGTCWFALPIEARAATADVFTKGRTYCASTHPNHGTPSGFGAAIDLNGRTDDYRWPVYAPGEGRVAVHSSGGGFGNSIIWTSANEQERVHMAHLDSFGHTGRVRAGDLIGRVGTTGHSTGSHLHASASVAGEAAAFVLQSRVIRPGRCYTSNGPIPPQCLGRDATVAGDRGRDRLVGSSADDVFYAAGGRDLVESHGGNDTVCGGPGPDTVVGGSASDHLSGGDADDVLRGGPGDDRLHGTDGRDLLSAGPGRDRLEGGAGRDRLVGHLGSDRISGGSNGDMLNGTSGRDLLAGGSGEDLLLGGSGRDKIEGQRQSDRVAGGASADTLSGGRGKDVLQGGEGGDELRGDDAADRLAGGIGDDDLVGGGGEDAATYDGSGRAVAASLAQGTAAGNGQDSLAGIDGLIGSAYGDSLVGDGTANQLFGGRGADGVDGGGGDDFVDGGRGPDSLVGGLGLDLVSYARSAHSVEASLEHNQAATPEATDILDGFEALRGSRYGDVLTGDAENNVIYGEAGSDTLDGLGGNNRLKGGAGFDTCLNGATNDGCEA